MLRDRGVEALCEALMKNAHVQPQVEAALAPSLHPPRPQRAVLPCGFPWGSPLASAPPRSSEASEAAEEAAGRPDQI